MSRSAVSAMTPDDDAPVLLRLTKAEARKVLAVLQATIRDAPDRRHTRSLEAVEEKLRRIASDLWTSGQLHH